MQYNLELDRVIEKINSQAYSKVCIQLPDGLKPEAKKITDKIRENTDSEVFIWAGSCFGACDLPKVEGFDLLVQFGHSEYEY